MVLLTELSPFSSSTHDHNHRYDVFLSFRGADTRNRFTAHLYKALVQADYDTFLDDEEIETGEPLKPELESAIKSSRASVIVLSKNYASSTWCLDELVLILEQQKTFNQRVIPIFYDVEPTDVRKQQNSFGEAMAKHKKRMEGERDVNKRNEWARKMKLWGRALTEVAGLKGKDANKKETELIEEVVADIRHRLVVPLCDTPSILIGVDYYINDITSWLSDGSCHTADILTIVGIGGIGKTSLAKYVFQLYSSKFHKSSFIEGINTRCTDQFNELRDLRKQLHKVISKNSPLQVNDGSKKVFIVLDDIGSLNQLDVLLGNKGLYPGSKIIVTTKDASFTKKCALFNQQVQPNHKDIILNGLHKYNSLKLLCIHAFNSHTPEEGYEDVSKKLVEYCDGHPLALQVLGRSLQKEDITYWEGCIKVLNKEPHSDIQKVLRMSFDSLSSRNDKELFKHIACFFVGIDRDLTKTILEACGINTTYGMRNLINRCLISIDSGNRLMMHSLIHEMGRDLVRQEYPEKPWKRSRLWHHEECFKVMKNKKDKENLLGLSLDMRMLDEKKFTGSLELNTNSLSNMHNLLLLQLNYVQLDECFQSFPAELRWLCMHGFPLTSIHLNIPMENLVVLDMRYSNIVSFDISYSDAQPPAKKQKKMVESCSSDTRLLGSLKILDLSYCEQLHSVGGFYELPALEKLILSYCRNLMELCESVEQSVELVYIDLSYCKKLKKLPISLGKLKVKTLKLDGCNYLWESTTSSAIIVEAIPSDFKFFVTFLPRSLSILSLAYANLSNESFPMDLSCLAMLKELCLAGNPIVSLPICVRTLPRIEKLSMDYCDVVTSVEHLPRTLRVFSIYTFTKNKLRKIKFDPEMSPLKLRTHPTLDFHSSLEIEGIIKIQNMADVEEKLLDSLGWKKSDFIKGGLLETHDIWMGYQFGIFGTFYWEKGMPEWIRCRSEGPSISFIIPSSPKKVRGLNFCSVKWPPYFGKVMPTPATIIKNITKNQTWSYNHFLDFVSVEGKDCFSWLSHWMFGPNEMEAGDHIIIKCDLEMECEVGVGVVYDDGSMEEGEDVLSYYKSWNHIIGGDLSAFQITTGEYNLYHMKFTRNFQRTYKEKEMMFKAFSQKKSETDGSQAQCSQTRPTAMAPAEALRMVMFPHGLGQHTFDGQAQPIFTPPQPGSGQVQGQLLGGSRVGVPEQQNQQQPVPLMRQQMLNEDLYPLVEQLEAESAVKHQLVPDMSPGGGPMANFFMPMIPPGQHEPPPGGSCVGVPQQQNNQQLVPLMQQQPAFGHQQQLVPDMIPDGGTMPNFYMPMVPPGQHEPQPGGSGIGVPEQQNNQQLVPLIQQQMVPYGPMSHLPPGSNIGDVSMCSVSYDIGNVRRLHDVGGISEPANASPTAQSTMLDENLYPLVEQMDMTEILDWLELQALEVMNTE